MKVFQLDNDVNHYQYFLPERAEDTLALRMDGTPRAMSWSPPPVFVYQPKHKIGDLYNFSIDPLIFSPRATAVLRLHLQEAGELLPLAYMGGTYMVLNVLTLQDCLDEERSGERLRGYKPLAFYPDRLAAVPSVFFKLPQDHTETYLVEGLRSPDSEVRHLAAVAGLKGIIFNEVWSDGA